METLALVISATAALLPVAGVIARWTRYLFDTSIPTSAVLAASVPELIATGFSALWPGISVLVIVALYASRRLPTAPPPDPALRIVRWSLRIVQAIWVVLLAIVVLTASFPSTWLVLAGSTAIGETIGRASRGEVHWRRRVLPAAALIVVVSAVASGITPSAVRTVSVTFLDALAIPRDSTYVLLGETDHGFFLRPCGSTRERDARVLEVPRSSVVAMSFAAEMTPAREITFPEFLAGRPLDVGFRAVC